MENIPLRYLKGIGPKKEKLFSKLGIFSLKDLLYYFPFKYQDRRNVSKISSIKTAGDYLIKAEVISLSFRTNFITRRHICEATLKDESGRIKAVWFNQPYLKNYLKKREKIFVFGPVRPYKERLWFMVPEFERVSSDSLASGRIVPFYRLTKGLSQRLLRRAIFLALSKYKSQITDFLPFSLRRNLGLANLSWALENIHFPVKFQDLEAARRRFIFEEFFLMQVLVYYRKAKARQPKPQKIERRKDLILHLKSQLEFELTTAQERAWAEIEKDLVSPYPLRRLLQGDVGCGKTVVAFLAMALAAGNSLQVAFMAPTEILAWQHFNNLKNFLKSTSFNLGLLTSSCFEKEKIIKAAAEGKIDILVGTHALLNEKLHFRNLGLIVIDEQHRFGVAQKALLFKKAQQPDVLIMSATPIPRSLALTLYGDLDLSVIDKLPPGRKKPQVIVFKEKEREKAYKIVESEVKKKHQAYMIYPLVKEEEDERSVIYVYKKLQKVFSQYRLGLIYGRLNTEEKEKALSAFQKGEIDILVSTSVVEVGIDVPRANVMVVEGVDKFGLSQLHQLRGRISRSHSQPFFILIRPDNLNLDAQKRLLVLKRTADGFRIAEEDLRLRGPGDLFGTLQAGFLPANIADPVKDIETLKKARISAYQLIKKDPQLSLPPQRFLREKIKEDLEKCLLWQAS